MEKTLTEVTATAGLFKSRLANKVIEREGTSFTLQALPSLLASYIIGAAQDENGKQNQGIFRTHYLRHGIKGIANLKDEDGHLVQFDMDTVRILDRDYQAIPWRILDGLMPSLLGDLFLEIFWLTHLTEAEREKLDFTTPSPNTQSTETTGDGEDSI